jgi:non-ribosomal peptide synthetase component F
MVGLFINTLPIRVRVAPEMRVGDWLRQIQKEQLDTRQYEYSPLSRVQGWSDVERGSPLFQSILVFENYPSESSSPSAVVDQGGPVVWDIGFFIKESYPMTLEVEPGSQLLLHLKYDTSLFDAATIRHMSEHLQTLLQDVFALSNVWQQTLGEVLERTHAEQQVNEERKVKEFRFQSLKNVKRKVVSGST